MRPFISCLTAAKSRKDGEEDMLHFNEHELSHEPGQATERHLLVGVDTPLTPATQYALHTVGTFFAPYGEHLHLLVLTVISTPYPLSPTREQQTQAEETLQEVHSALQHDGMSPPQIKMLIRAGIPADELAAVASKRHIDCIVIGSRSNSPGQRFRRWLFGSTSRRVLKLAPCPVLVVTLPRSRHPRDLVAWYEAAILQSLHDQSHTLASFTTQGVAGRFLPHQTHTVGRKERRAAARALEHLAHAGVLCRRDMHGEVWYLND
jgi:nucleotide-binding universal stress UspA family protein